MGSMDEEKEHKTQSQHEEGSNSALSMWNAAGVDIFTRAPRLFDAESVH